METEKPARWRAFSYFHSKFRIPDPEDKHAKKDWVILTICVANNGVASQVTCVRLDSFQQGAVVVRSRVRSAARVDFSRKMRNASPFRSARLRPAVTSF